MNLFMNPEGQQQNHNEPEMRTHHFETTSVGGKVYNVALLESVAETIESKKIPLPQLQEAVGEGHFYWVDRKGEKLGPHQLLEDWEAAQKNDAWVDHVETIKRADTANAIWMTSDGFVFNGMHHLTRAFLDGKKTILVKVFLELPSTTEVKD